ncbi:hypothetical protein CLV91_2373 [Maribacter vaceletii]|uniref:DoxX-like protein n=1 Tax=Maribacter vaceletii TaxID=1206816 RepID=A0A495E8W4_9FLAO|nr:DoxX family protein [Maribacter vaceletii]RKR12247.1 hypothetical protein CLV91_2373 [Maribacter vaceletii]
MNKSIVKVFLRTSLSLSFLSAVADRLGLWPRDISAWGNWKKFLDYTHTLTPYLPEFVISPLGYIVTILETFLSFSLLIGYKTEFNAKISGYLLLLFALAMTFTSSIKGALDYSVLTASAAAFALSLIPSKFLEIDTFLKKKVID